MTEVVSASVVSVDGISSFDKTMLNLDYCRVIVCFGEMASQEAWESSSILSE